GAGEPLLGQWLRHRGGARRDRGRVRPARAPRDRRLHPPGQPRLAAGHAAPPHDPRPGGGFRSSAVPARSRILPSRALPAAAPRAWLVTATAMDRNPTLT